jgi:cell wall-associated NlpC family hydrolase
MTRLIPTLILTFLLLSSCQQTQTVDTSTATAATRPGGFDCSGLIWYSYKKVGVNTPRTSKELRKHAKKISRKKMKAGDLVFFKGWVRTGHVGIYIGNGRFIHAPSSGKKVKIDATGMSILNQQAG